MTEKELKQSLNIVSTNYSKPLDENIITLWKVLFLNFDSIFFKKACLKVIAENKYFPNASEIIDAYQYVKYEDKQNRYASLRENQRLLAAEQEHCYLCDNTGFCFYPDIGYRHVMRCVCLHGQDLNKFSEPQIKRGQLPEIREYYSEREQSDIKRGKNPFYFPTVQEALKEDFAIFEARKKEKYLSRKAMSEEQKAEAIKRMSVLQTE